MAGREWVHDDAVAQDAAVLPQYVDFRCNDDGTMWLRPMDLEAGGMAGSMTWLRHRARPERAGSEVPGAVYA